MKTSEIMTRTVVTIGREAPLREAIRRMLDNRISGLPVVDEAGRIVGILTEGDLLHRSETGTERHRRHWLEFLMGPGRAAGDYVKAHGRRVVEVMTHDVVSVAPDMPLDKLVALMERRRFKRFPVLEGGALVGIVGRADLMAALARKIDGEPVAAGGDDEIRERVLAELARAAAWAPQSGLSVTVKDGIVAFDGVILDESEREALRVVAENVPGVKAVEDRLVWVEPMSGTIVDPTEEPPSPAPTHSSPVRGRG